MIDWEMRALAAEALLAEKEQELADMEAELEIVREQNKKLRGGKPEPKRSEAHTAMDDLIQQKLSLKEAHLQDMIRYMSYDPAIKPQRFAKIERRMMELQAEPRFRPYEAESQFADVYVSQDHYDNKWRFSIKFRDGGGDATCIVDDREVNEALRRRNEGELMMQTSARLLAVIADRAKIPPPPKEAITQVAHMLLREFKGVRR